MKWIFFFLMSLSTSGLMAQVTTSKKLDSVSKKVLLYLKNKQADSIYAMTGKSFREKITAENFNAVSNDQIFQINNFADVKFVSNAQGVNKYKVEGTPALQLLIGIDATDKIEALLIQPYVED